MFRTTTVGADAEGLGVGEAVVGNNVGTTVGAVVGRNVVGDGAGGVDPATDVAEVVVEFGVGRVPRSGAPHPTINPSTASKTKS